MAISNSSFNSILSVMLTQNPKDPLELMLINQMTSVNALVMKYIGRLGKSQTISEIEIADGRSTSWRVLLQLSLERCTASDRRRSKGNIAAECLGYG